MANRAALVTGGMGGIGTAICRRLADDGNRVVALDIVAEPDQARRWLDAEKDGGYEFSVVTGDVTDFGSCAAAVAKAEEGAGPIEILVNAAGITRDGTLRKMEVDQWRAVLSTNLDSVFNVTKQVIDGMTERGFGRIFLVEIRVRTGPDSCRARSHSKVGPSRAPSLMRARVYSLRAASSLADPSSADTNVHVPPW